RGCYETPGGTILLHAHRAIESITLDREVAHLKDDLMPRYASMIYNGYWWSPERRALQVLIDHTQEPVNGTVVVRLYKGNVIVVSRKSENSLFDARISTFEDDAGASIELTALRMRTAAGKEAAGSTGGRRRGGARSSGNGGAAAEPAAAKRGRKAAVAATPEAAVGAGTSTGRTRRSAASTASTDTGAASAPTRGRKGRAAASAMPSDTEPGTTDITHPDVDTLVTTDAA